MTLETFMKSERSLYQKENPTDYANGFRTRGEIRNNRNFPKKSVMTFIFFKFCFINRTNLFQAFYFLIRNIFIKFTN